MSELKAQRAIGPAGLSPIAVKQCCAAVYGSDAAKLILGDSLHPGGRELTERLGEMLGLRPRMRVLDVAAGRGASALTMARRFGCDAIGLDLSWRNMDAARREVSSHAEVMLCCGDAERLPFADGSVDAITCECALCTFPDKRAAAAEFARVLRPGGRLGMSDLTRQGTLPAELAGFAGWIACVADAQPLADYAALFAAAGLQVTATQEHGDALIDFVNRIRACLLVAEVAAGLNKVSLGGFDIAKLKDFIRHALDSIRAGNVGYAILIAAKSL